MDGGWLIDSGWPTGWRHRVLAGAVERYLDGEADAATAVAARRHVEHCWRCSEDAEWILLMKAVLGRIEPRRPEARAVIRLERFARGLAGHR